MFHIETAISFALQIMPGFYKMECCTRLKWVKREYSLQQILNLTLPIYFSGIFINRTQNSSENLKRFWRLRFGRRSVVRPPSNGEGLRNIQHSMNMLLDTGFHIWFVVTVITKCDRYYYKMRQLFYYKMRQKCITKCVRFFIIKCDIFINIFKYAQI